MTGERRDPAEVLIHIDRALAEPLPVQLARALRGDIVAGRLRPGDDLPSTRQLSVRAGVSRGVVVAAFEQLIAEGYVLARTGRGTTVNPRLPTLTSGTSRAKVGAEDASETSVVRRAPLSPGAGPSGALDSSVWRSAWRSALTHADIVLPPFGYIALRREISDHLRRIRATPTGADDIIVTAGAREGLGLVLNALRERGASNVRVGVEDPGYPSLRAALRRHGGSVVPLSVDEDGLRVDDLPREGVDAVLVTPSHQYPLGGSLPLSRRLALLGWARGTGAYVIEDDFDSEFRVSGSPLPMLAALDDEQDRRVVSLGTFSSTVTPAVAAGYVRAPHSIRTSAEPVRQDLGSPVAVAVQVALAEYLSSGALRRNIARQRRRYAKRRALVSRVFEGSGALRVRPSVGGLHIVLEFIGEAEVPESRREDDLVALANARVAEYPAGLGVAALGAYWQHDAPERAAGIVIGMGGTNDAEYAAAVARLRELVTN